MWPGQQPPGGEQNPQDQNAPNPYQQQGYQQPNPYQQHPGYQQPGYPQQAGYGQPNPYQQPTAPQYAVPGQPPAAAPPASGSRRTTVVVATASALAVLTTAGVTGYVVLGDDGKEPVAKPGAKPAASVSAPADPTPSAVDNPRAGDGAAQPTIPGWKVVYNPKYGTLFDVPGDWEVSGSGNMHIVTDEKEGGAAAFNVMSAPAYYKSEWCSYDAEKDGTADTWGLASTGTKGGQGAKDTGNAALNEAGTWAWSQAQDEPKEKVKLGKPAPYTTTSGLTGHVATAKTENTKHEHKCDTETKAIAFSFKNAKGDFSTWCLYGPTGVKDELPEATIQKILSTVRLADEQPKQ
ncbi:hypothetical protein BJP40_25905 [Streptomyces sp. CC53]|uniref:hypothetical protein n=1 Tax=unclassified Streptomyces TaxID=2593676 RepID=UPI0008DC8D7A|nr:MULTISPECIES: hypothetical protein [unclassified Streptomyces]OII63082.1 hypothetical protein BJP40_25905 [Streptomyces sp. CC53]